MSKIYLGDVGLSVVVDVGQDISEASSCSIEVRKPDGSQASWEAETHTIAGETNYLRHVTVDGDLDLCGRYLVQAHVSLLTWSGSGETTSFKVYPRFR